MVPSVNKSAILETLRNIPIMGKLTIVLAFLLLISLVAFGRKIEGFMDKSEFVTKEGPAVFDDFYATIYDAIAYDEVKNTYEIGEIINKTSPDSESIILDIGSGLGHNVVALTDSGLKAYGIDFSEDMVKASSKSHPQCTFLNADVLDTMSVAPESVTHILCLDKTMYYIKDKRRFFQNCMSWLAPGGYLAVHLVNKDRFNPVMQKQATMDILALRTGRQLETRSKLDGLTYKGKYEVFPNDIAVYKEIFIDDVTQKTRQNNHILFMEPQKKILEQARDAGFIMLAQIDMLHLGYDYQYVYILQKPN